MSYLQSCSSSSRNQASFAPPLDMMLELKFSMFFILVVRSTPEGLCDSYRKKGWTDKPATTYLLIFLQIQSHRPSCSCFSLAFLPLQDGAHKDEQDLDGSVDAKDDDQINCAIFSN